MTVRTRVAPSPTGVPHIGTAYIALFNKALARRHNGKFILRVEDSDQSRSTESSELSIYRSLKWLGLTWDEGPDTGGEFGPYKTSQRLDIYRSHLQELLDNGGAFYCFCSAERINQIRQEAQKSEGIPGYDGHCLHLSEKQVQENLAQNLPYTVRLKVPREGSCTFTDQIRGEISIPWTQVDMQVLQKSDGFPTYHLCATVDDHLMGVTHILRGEEWLSSCPKHVLLYDYFGWQYQELFHLPLLRNPDQSKLSKRKNPTGIEYYRARGYLPEALLNYLALMGWSMPDQQEIFSFDELVEDFDLSRISPRGPVFDPVKLDWVNGKYLRELSRDEFAQKFNEWVIADHKIEKTVELVQPRVERFDQVYQQVSYLLGTRPEVSEDSFRAGRLEPEECVKTLFLISKALETEDDWSSDHLHQTLTELANVMDCKLKDLVQPIFIALSGSAVALPLFGSMEILGPEITRHRIQDAVDALGGISKKRRKRLDKEWVEVSKELTK